jgi:uncharacterized membrane protein
VCIGPHAVAIADDSTVVVGNVQNASSDFTPYQFAPTSQALPGMDGTSFGGLDALTHQFNTGGFAEAAEGTRIVGEITRPGSGNDFHAVLWDTGTVTDLETQSRIPLQWSTAEAVNADDVCGSANGIPACWLSGVFVTLPTLSPYPDNGGDVTALNDQGNAAGASYVVGVGSHCAYWPVTGGVVDCHSPWAGAESAAEDMNNSNQIVGTTDTPGNPRPVFQRGFLVLPWGMILLEPFGGMERSQAHGINDLGLIVGESASGDGGGCCAGAVQVATIWENGVPYDLQPRLQGADGWTLGTALGVNNDGVTVARATSPQGQSRGVLLTPVQGRVAAYYAWRYQMHRYYQARYDRWRKQMAQYYYRGIGR